MDKNLCNNGSQHTNISEYELHTSLAYHRLWFILGQIFHGVGAAPILTLGSYIFSISFFNQNNALFTFNYSNYLKYLHIIYFRT